MKSQEILDYCQKQTTTLITQVLDLKSLPIDQLTKKSNPDSWCALECLEHLNLYADFYNPAIRSAIRSSKTSAQESFKSGWLGGYFAKSMLPKEKLNKMKTFKDKNPIHSKLEVSVVDRFLAQQRDFLELLDLAKNVDLNKVKTPVTISNLIRLKLGDTFQFLVNHNIRHMAQLERVLKG